MAAHYEQAADWLHDTGSPERESEQTMTTDIRHRIGIYAPQEEVHRALATTEGVASWWTRGTTGDATEGGKLLLSFGERGDLVLEVVEDALDRVEWRCLEGPDEWLVTSFAFELDQQGDETVVLFTQGGWAEPVPFQAHCTTKWGQFLLGMKSLLEGGQATPYPGEPQISSWD
jgi:hypothetical protein